MRITLTVTSGARNGVSKQFDQAYIGLGRHPQSDLQFDPEKDLDASTRHAAILKAGEAWNIRDLGSANGTWVNDEKITADRRLHTGDMVRLGAKGPILHVEVEGEAAPAAAATRLSGGHAPVPKGNTTMRVKAEVAKQTKTLRRATLVLFGLLIVVAGGYFWQRATYEKRIAELQAGMIQTLDSLQRELNNITVRFTGMQATLDAAQAESERLRGQIAAGGSTAQLQQLRAQLNAAVTRQGNIAAAAGLDGAKVDSLAGEAVALVFARMPDGKVYTGTAFAVKSDRNGSWLITNRHVVTSPEGDDPVEIGVMFNHTRQNFRARLVQKHPNGDIDLALIRVEIRDGTPVVPGIADGAQAGQPVVTIGFPFGVDLEGAADLQRTGAVATLTAGTVSRVTSTLVQIDGYGATGASGSPYLDRNGRVVAVLYGGERDSGGRIVYAVPARFIHDLMTDR
jgi:S1-C subfamily serine protease